MPSAKFDELLHPTKPDPNNPELCLIEYRRPDQPKVVELRVGFETETIWATEAQIAQLFDVDRSVAGKHLREIFKSGALDKSIYGQKMPINGRGRPTYLYSLDVIMAVGYRANSKRAVEFRKWSTAIIRDYLFKGAALNDSLLRKSPEKASALREKLDLYICPLRRWQKTFPDDLWIEFARITGLESDPLKGRPPVWGHLVNEFIYDKLDPDIRIWLKKNTPSSSKFHQNFNVFGLRELHEQLSVVIALARCCGTVEELRDMIEKSCPIPRMRTGEVISLKEAKELQKGDPRQKQLF